MFTRRRFLGSTLGGGALTTTGAQVAFPEGARKRIFIDAQIHLWKAESEDWKWVPGMKPQLPEPFSIERAGPYPFGDINPYIKRLFETFGPQRCYWGTDITNGFSRATWRQRVTHFTEALDFLTEDDKDWVMGRAIMERLKWS